MTTIARGPSSAAAEITSAAIASFDGCPDPRLRQIVQALIRHLHAFASEVQLTEDEWTRAIEILTRTGHITDDRRQEFILWSDALGLSMLVDALSHPSANGATESTVLGPFWTPNAPRRGYAESIAESGGGTPALVRGRVLDQDGRPIAGAELDIWQNGRITRRLKHTCAGVSTAATTGATPSSACGPCRTRFRTTGRSGPCSKQHAAIHGGRRIYT